MLWEYTKFSTTYTMKKIVIIVIFILAFLALGFFLLLGWYNEETTRPNSTDSTKINIDIKVGESAESVAKKLSDNNLISSADLFLFYVKRSDQSSKLKAGSFSIAKNLTFDQILNILNDPKEKVTKVFFPEGLRSDEIAEVLENIFVKEDSSKFSKKEFLDIVKNPTKYDLNSVIVTKYLPKGKSLEGFLFPDTYQVDPKSTAKDLVQKFLTNFETRFVNLYEESNKKYSMYDTVNLASIIEREAKGEDEKKNVADILIKRLDGKGDGTKLLAVDAPFLYELKNWKYVITNETKAKDSPYNTYKTAGLPATPISNPGLDSLSSVLSPTKNDYLYYLHGVDGVIRYAKTLGEHTRNIRCYINENQSFCN